MRKDYTGEFVLTEDGRHLMCECGHPDRVHEDIDQGHFRLGWGDGKCQLCGCKNFHPIERFEKL